MKTYNKFLPQHKLISGIFTKEQKQNKQRKRSMGFQAEGTKKLKVWEGLIFMQLSTQSSKEEIFRAANNRHSSGNGD